MTNLFQPFRIANVLFKNRLLMAPMCMFASDQHGEVNDFHLTHYETRAIGGIGGIIVEASAVEERGVISANDLGIWDDKQIHPLQNLVTKVHKHKVPIGIQLAHAGRKGLADRGFVSASALAFDDTLGVVPKALSIGEIQAVTQAFRQSALRALAAGFDFIEIHAAHGYLINQFMSAESNHRTDQYGGSIENRGRFLREIIEAVREVIPSSMLLCVRVSAQEYISTGNQVADVAAIINGVKQAGLDLVNVSSGGLANVSVPVYPGYQLNLAQQIKQLTNLPVIAGGLLDTRPMVQEVIENKRADLVFLGRPLLRNPYLPSVWAAELGCKDLIIPNYVRAF